MQTMDDTITFAEALTLVSEDVTLAQLSALAFIAGIKPAGVRHTGRRGRPAAIYPRVPLLTAVTIEAQRTAKQFTDCDWIASALLGRRLVQVDTTAGTITWTADGTRAEQLGHDNYGHVHAGNCHCMAHRLIWIAAEGEIPRGLQVNHINRRRWDNRRTNLQLVTLVENIRHGHGKDYLTYHDAVAQLAALPPPLDEMPPPASKLIRTGGAFRRVW